MLIIRGTSECLLSKEGVIKGDPPVYVYAIGTLPLIHSFVTPLTEHRFGVPMMHQLGALWKIFMKGFLFFILGVQHLAIFPNLLRDNMLPLEKL